MADEEEIEIEGAEEIAPDEIGPDDWPMLKVTLTQTICSKPKKISSLIPMF